MAERNSAKRRRRLTLLDYALMAAVALAFGLGAATALSMQPDHGGPGQVEVHT